MHIAWLEILKKRLTTNQKKIALNVYWAVLGKVVNIISGLLIGIAVARYLGPENFGLMNYIISYVTLFTILASFGLENIVIRELAKAPSNKNTILGSAFAIRLCFAGITILLILATLIAFESDRFTFIMVMVYSLSLVFLSLSVIRYYFTSVILNEYVVKTEISRTVIGALIKVVLLLNHCSLVWFIVASTFDFVLIGGGYVYSYRKMVGPLRDWKSDWPTARMLMRESFPMMLSGTAVIIYQKIDAVMIRNMMDNASVGEFSVAAKFTELAIFLPVVIAQTVAPLLVRAHQSDKVRYHEKRQEFMDLMVWSALAMALVITVSASPLIRILYGEKYLNSIPVLQILAWKAVFVALFSASGQLIIIEGLQRYAVIRNIIGCVVCVFLNLLLIPVWGVVGSALAAILTTAFSGYFSHFLIRQYHFLVPMQTKALFLGWVRIKNVKKKRVVSGE